MSKEEKMNNQLEKNDQTKEDEQEEEKKLKYESLKKAGDIAKQVKKFIKPKIKVGAKVLEIVNLVEDKIREMGGSCAFPVNLSINNIAAHYTSPLRDDELEIQENDLIKLDLGVHIEGYIVDTAFSVNFNQDEALENIITATQTALEAAKMMIKPGIHTSKIGKKIEEIIKGFNYNPIKELGGHQIERWIVHGTKALPELGSQGGDEIEEEDIFAVEIFASTGPGSVHNTNNCHIYALNPYSGRVPLRRKSSKKILAYINRNFKTLPFAERWLGKEFQLGVAFGLQELVQQGKLNTHHVLSEKKDVFVAQSEDTVLVNEEGYEQLT
ncbi:MAG: type II methionyl aminopeptidase [Candidatus Lokiarchaeota archaeon]|nr:type II methionyl aminopeptidase [Candidatus Lokiarchaeota archaeon]MBD3202433.1 type II methionyl aminopeptidase [Candidatus Lokiarchaeota archaeon]